MREFLKGLGLDNETIDTIMAEHGKLMTKTKEENSTLRDRVRELEDKVKPFEGVNLEEMKNQIQTLTTEKETAETNHKAAITELKKSYAIKAAVAKSAPLDDVAYMAHLDLSKIQYNEADDTLTGFNEQDEQIRKQYSYMFNSSAGGQEHGGIDSNGGASLSLEDAVKSYYGK